MKNKAGILAVLFGLLLGGISYWLKPADQVQILGSNIPLIWSLGAFFGTFLIMIFFNDHPPKIAVLFILGVELAIIARIFFDSIFWDNTSHNLFPFEILLCGIITTPGAFVGVYLAVLIKKLKK